jgi:transposase
VVAAAPRGEIEALPLPGWYAHRRADLLGLLDELDKRIRPLDEAVREAAEGNREACLLMTHPGVGPIVSLAYVLTIGDWRRFPRGKQVGSYLGLIPAEESSGDKRRLGTSASRATRCCAGCWWRPQCGATRTMRAGTGSMFGCR